MMKLVEQALASVADIMPERWDAIVATIWHIKDNSDQELFANVAMGSPVQGIIDAGITTSKMISRRAAFFSMLSTHWVRNQ